MNKIFIFLVLVIFISCSQTKQLLYEKNYPLTNKSVESKKTSYKVKIPQGWYSPTENSYELVDIWLVDERLTAQIVVLPLNINNFDKSISLKDIINLNIRQKKAELGDKYKEVIPAEHFFINSIEFYSFQYYDFRNLPVRTVYFKLNDIYFECVASFSEKIIPEKANPSTLFKVQNSVLNSISLK